MHSLRAQRRRGSDDSGHGGEAASRCSSRLPHSILGPAGGGDGVEVVECEPASEKKRQISALALGPLGSPCSLALGEPDHACPSPSTNHFSINTRPSDSVYKCCW